MFPSGISDNRQGRRTFYFKNHKQMSMSWQQFNGSSPKLAPFISHKNTVHIGYTRRRVLSDLKKRDADIETRNRELTIIRGR